MAIGGPLRGMRRALRISVCYLATYFTWGALALIGLSMALDWAPGGLTKDFTFHFGISTLLVFPSSFVLNCFMVRWFRGRTWRGKAGRFWLVGFLGIVLTWGLAFILIGLLWGLPLVLALPKVFGVEFRAIEVWTSCFLLVSNLAIFLGWILPWGKASR